MSDEWETHLLDLPAYLKRIGLTDEGELSADGATLARLHRAHVAAIRFENLDVVLGRGIATDFASVQAKLVERGRGGYCYEQNLLLAVVLNRLGFEVDRLLARVGIDEERPRSRTHLVLRVRGLDGQWLADVGFGAGLLSPLPWGGTGPQRQGGWTYDLLDTGRGEWRLRQLEAGNWTELYTFTEAVQHASDIAVANYYTATHPSSRFVGQPIVMSKDETGLLRLVGRRLDSVRPDGSSDQRQLTDGELAEVLRSEFGLPLSAEEVAKLVAVPPRSRADL